MKNFDVCAISAVFMGVVGCAELPRHGGPTIYRSDIINGIRCELFNALKSETGNSFLKSWTAVVSLTLNETNDATQTLSAGIAIPLVPGILTINSTGQAIGTAIRTASTEFSVSLASLNVDACGEPYVRLDKNKRPLLEGNLRIGEEFSRVRESYFTINDKGKFISHSYTTNFEIQLSNDSSGVFTVIPIGDTTFGATIGLKGRKVKGHEMKLTIKQPPTKKPDPIEVVIVGSRASIPKTKGLSPLSSTVRPSDRATGRIIGDPNSPAAVDDTIDAQSRDVLRQIQRDIRRDRFRQ